MRWPLTVHTLNEPPAALGSEVFDLRGPRTDPSRNTASVVRPGEAAGYSRHTGSRTDLTSVSARFSAADQASLSS